MCKTDSPAADQSSIRPEQTMAGRADVDVGRGRLSRNKTTEGVVWNVIGFEIAPQPHSRLAIREDGYVYSIAVIVTKGAMRGRAAVRAHREGFVELILICQENALEIFRRKRPCSIEALHHATSRR